MENICEVKNERLFYNTNVQNIYFEFTGKVLDGADKSFAYC